MLSKHSKKAEVMRQHNACLSIYFKQAPQYFQSLKPQLIIYKLRFC